MLPIEMYANTTYDDEREEIISILKGFDFCFMIDANPTTTKKYKKIAKELDERLVKLGKKKGVETLEMVAYTRGGDVYRDCCPTIFPRLYGNEEEVKEQEEKKENKKIAKKNAKKDQEAKEFSLQGEKKEKANKLLEEMKKAQEEYEKKMQAYQALTKKRKIKYEESESCASDSDSCSDDDCSSDSDESDEESDSDYSESDESDEESDSDYSESDYSDSDSDSESDSESDSDYSSDEESDYSSDEESDEESDEDEKPKRVRKIPAKKTTINAKSAKVTKKPAVKKITKKN